MTKKRATAKRTASAKKTTTKAKAKPSAKKPAPKAKATTAKKAVARKPVTKATTKKPVLKAKTAKRPSVSSTIPLDTVQNLSNEFSNLRTTIEEFAAHMRALDRRRLNGIGIKRQGFTERAFQLAQDNQEFLPHWLPFAKFQDDMAQFIGLRNLFDLNKQIGELIWNLVMQSSDMAYTDALEFYTSVREAAKRRVDAAESPYEELFNFWRRGKMKGDQPTEAELDRDLHSLVKGRKDGKIVVENVRPKTTGGSRKVVDETFRDKAAFKDTDEGEITE